MDRTDGILEADEVIIIATGAVCVETDEAQSLTHNMADYELFELLKKSGAHLMSVRS